ncbi:MAG: hypothetical protein NTW86_23245 [Candidatus Sumerlaeota bacterium]|nr:hypothetical protein [Candidatus Sumerlaeota bacterium]
MTIHNAGAAKAEAVVPQDAAGAQIHVILEVRDASPIASMFAYRRIVIDVEK